MIYISVFTFTVLIKCFQDRDHPVNINCVTYYKDPGECCDPKYNIECKSSYRERRPRWWKVNTILAVTHQTIWLLGELENGPGLSLILPGEADEIELVTPATSLPGSQARICRQEPTKAGVFLQGLPST